MTDQELQAEREGLERLRDRLQAAKRGPTPIDWEKELASFRRGAEEILADEGKARAFLLDGGFAEEGNDGKLHLAARYR